MAFHGGGVDAEHMVTFSGLNEKSEEAGFIVVYPYGTGRLRKILTFNAGDCCGYAERAKIDDVAFTRRLLDDLARLVNVDPKRVYATGMSNGAIMAYRLASELSERIAAIAPVAGTMGITPILAKRPVSVMHFHGTADESLPFRGGRGKGFSDTDFYPVEQSIRAWVEANGCRQEPIIDTIADRAQDGTTIIRKTYGGGRDGTEVVLVLINGGGHTWPGRESRAKVLGKSTKNISATDMMWEFFVKHPIP
ncbi:MAG: hypothetical protein KatS3mg082_1845 [Nitrospiraceae bacterium]|nr:MAG: hypothetical protein KatS3mg082_1845 [Nitrospiraceae bacterium]